jgi:predicted amidohydrolase
LGLSKEVVSMSLGKIHIGVIQLDIKTGEPAINQHAVYEGMRGLAEKNTRIVVLPELWSSGFDSDGMQKHAETTPEIFRALSKQAIAHRMMIAGSMPEFHNGHVYNTLFLIDENGVAAGSYRKIHLFPPLGESACFQAGDRPVVCETSLGVIGLMICYDLRFPELARSLALQGAQMILVSAQWPRERIEHWDVLLRARAIENQVFIIACNRCGADGELSFPGHSQIVSPSGKVLAMLDDRPGVMACEIDLAEIAGLKNQFDCLSGRIPEAYTL